MRHGVLRSDHLNLAQVISVLCCPLVGTVVTSSVHCKSFNFHSHFITSHVPTHIMSHTGVHYTIVSLAFPQTIENIRIDLARGSLEEVEETCHFLSRLSLYRREWRLHLPQVLNRLMVRPRETKCWFKVPGLPYLFAVIFYF